MIQTILRGRLFSKADKLTTERKNGKLRGLLHGSIVLGKSNLSEFFCYRGNMLPNGWSAMGGLDPPKRHQGRSTQQVGLFLGLGRGRIRRICPWSIGTETDGSLICPCGRAALYTVKPTIEWSILSPSPLLDHTECLPAFFIPNGRDTLSVYEAVHKRRHVVCEFQTAVSSASSRSDCGLEALAG